MNQYNYDKDYLQKNNGESVWETIVTFILAGIMFVIVGFFLYALSK